MTEKLTTEAEAITALTAQPVITEINGTPVVLSPKGFDVFLHPTLLSNPTRKTGTVTLVEVESFIDTIKRQGSDASTVVYLDVDYVKQTIAATAVFNEHDAGDGKAGWRDHRATFSPRFSEEWRRWNLAHKKAFKQAEFAQFLEENIGDIVSPNGGKLPTGSDVLTFVSCLEETRNVKYGSAINLQNGMVQIEFVEQGDSATKGKLDVFKRFAIGVRPFFKGTGYQLEALLRYRIDRNSGEITFWFDLQRPDRVLEDASTEIVEAIRAKAGVPVVFGDPGR